MPLLSIAGNETNPAAQKANAEALVAGLTTEAAQFDSFLAAGGAVPPPIAASLHEAFAAYAARARETAEFAAYDASYGALLAGITDDRFGILRADLDDSGAGARPQRREALAREAIADSLAARHLLLGFGLGAAVLALLGSVLVGRSIARPTLELARMMKRLAGGDTDLSCRTPNGATRSARWRAQLKSSAPTPSPAGKARSALRRTNLLFDAALNSMLQGMVVLGPDHRVQLVNGRFFAISGMTPGSIKPGTTLREAIEAIMPSRSLQRQGSREVCAKVDSGAGRATLDAGRDGGAPRPARADRDASRWPMAAPCSRLRM